MCINDQGFFISIRNLSSSIFKQSPNSTEYLLLYHEKNITHLNPNPLHDDDSFQFANSSNRAFC